MCPRVQLSLKEIKNKLPIRNHKYLPDRHTCKLQDQFQTDMYYGSADLKLLLELSLLITCIHCKNKFNLINLNVHHVLLLKYVNQSLPHTYMHRKISRQSHTTVC